MLIRTCSPCFCYIQGGEQFPAAVHAELVYDLGGCASQVRSEWDALGKHDVVFCLSVAPPLQPLQQHPEGLPAATVREGFGIMAVRGAEVVEVLDQEGVCISEPNPLNRQSCAAAAAIPVAVAAAL